MNMVDAPRAADAACGVLTAGNLEHVLTVNIATLECAQYDVFLINFKCMHVVAAGEPAQQRGAAADARSEAVRTGGRLGHRRFLQPRR